MAFWHRPTACERAGQWISLNLDDELSELEQAGLDRHLGHCARCRALAAHMLGLTQLLRTAPLVELGRELVVGSPRRTRARVLSRAGIGVAVAAAAAAAAAVLISTSAPGRSTARAIEFRSAQEQIRFVQANELRLEPAPVAVVLAVAPRIAARSL
jgi:hypothetical protein